MKLLLIPKYEHESTVQLFGDFLVGYWKNTNSKNIGAFQLFINTNMCVMNGLHLGNANDNSIQSGAWIVIKINDQVSEENNKLIRGGRLKDPEELTNLLNRWQTLASPIHLSDVLLRSSELENLSR